MTFTTRPDLTGTFGMVATTHWIATAAGMRMLELGGTAADAAAAAGFVLTVVEPHLNGPLGEAPILVLGAGEEAPWVICGQGSAPAAATIAHYRAEGLDMIPGAGLLAAVVPGAFGAWMRLLEEYGCLPLAEVMAPAIHYADAGHPILAAAANSIASMAEVFSHHWPASAAVWMPGGTAPGPGTLFRNPALAGMLRRILNEAGMRGSRSARIARARRAFYQGFVAEAVDAHIRADAPIDGLGVPRRGVLTADDMASWQETVEAPVSVGYHGWTVWKCGPWTQGPVLLQALQTLRGDDLGGLDPNGPDFVHLVTEALKRAFADRDAYYGDPAQSSIPLDRLLTREYGAERRATIGGQAQATPAPGAIPGFETWAEAYRLSAARPRPSEESFGGGEPTMAHLLNRPGDTVHIDVVDQWGNMVSATPSGGWLRSNPVIPELGVPLNNRGQMFWLEEGRPTSLAPGRRPRTTLTPSMARAPDGRLLAFGTPGGDQQEQWQLSFLLRHIHHRLSLQQAIEAPLFHTADLQASFYPRGVVPNRLVIEPAAGEATIAELRRRGHDVAVSAPWALGRLTAVSRDANGLVSAAATPRLMQAYAAGR
jgi:gamma-glutamyltranspeptidase/glutathione hydrolase